MGFFDPSDKKVTTRELARLTGENIALLQAVVLLIRQAPDPSGLRAALLLDLAVLQERERDGYRSPAIAMAMQDTIDKIRLRTERI